jgi:cell division protein ZapB
MKAFTATSDSPFEGGSRATATPTIHHPSSALRAMSRIEELVERVERLLLRHEEVQRTNALLHEQLAAVTHERDNLRSRLNAARSRIDVLLERLPREPEAVAESKTRLLDGAAEGELRSVG